ncbi:hypothetical protein GGX14DRAFT_605207 [Mycena pura]|uniref:Uncharacterized protein n=1 Tax=Mycena pura TaxID=153505 RepID=A0AAD6VLI7_9AGAR|nr:hypothetical protein GGX14DRAFT_605207 [Mycena pura]
MPQRRKCLSGSKHRRLSVNPSHSPTQDVLGKGKGNRRADELEGPFISRKRGDHGKSLQRPAESPSAFFSFVLRSLFAKDTPSVRILSPGVYTLAAVSATSRRSLATAGTAPPLARNPLFSCSTFWRSMRARSENASEMPARSRLRRRAAIRGNFACASDANGCGCARQNWPPRAFLRRHLRCVVGAYTGGGRKKRRGGYIGYIGISSAERLIFSFG